MTTTSGDRRAVVLAALKTAPEGVSGEALGAVLGVSRVAVRKHVAALRLAGYDIAARPGAGYRLRSVPDAPLPDEVAPLLNSRMWVRLEGGGITGSTNDDCKELAAEGAVEGTVVLAREQAGGKGRLGRTWTSPEGGVYLSALLRPDFGPGRSATLSPALGLGVALGLERLGAQVRLKWPNDVLVPPEEGSTAWRKIAGILLESLTEGERVAWVVAGVGVNVRCRPDEPGHIACLDDVIEHQPLATVAAAVLDGIAVAYETVTADGFGALRDAYAARDVLAGRDVTVRDRSGRSLASGRVAGIDEFARLVLDGPAGSVPVTSGEVTLREPDPIEEGIA